MVIVGDSLRYNCPTPDNTEEYWVETRGIRVMGKHGLWCLIIALAAMPALGAPNPDVVIINNGDRLTGEV